MFYQLNRNHCNGKCVMMLSNLWRSPCFTLYCQIVLPVYKCRAWAGSGSVLGFSPLNSLSPFHFDFDWCYWLVNKIMENCFRMCFQIPTYLLVNPGLPPDIRSIFYYFFHRHNIGIFSAFSSLKLSPYLSACFYLSYWKMLGICSRCTTM